MCRGYVFLFNLHKYEFGALCLSGNIIYIYIYTHTVVEGFVRKKVQFCSCYEDSAAYFAGLYV